MQNPSPDVSTNETPPIDAPHGEAAPAGKPLSTPKPAGKGAASKLFDPKTRLGRFMRSLTRILAAIVAFFALGMLAAYLLLYRPLANQTDSNRADLAQAREQVEQLQKQVGQAQQDVSRLSQSNQELSAKEDQAKAREALLSARVSINQARYSLAIKDAIAARQDLGQVPAELDQLAQAAGSENAAQVADLRSRLTLAQGEIDRDPQTALSDLGIINAQLADLGKRVFGG